MFELTKRQEEIIEDLGWRIIGIDSQDGTPYLEIENWSPAGEDLCETIWIKDGQTLAEAAREWAKSFDKDDHVELYAGMRGERGVPGTVRELVDDADAIQAMFNELADALEEAEEDEYGEVKTYCVPVIWEMYGHVCVEARSKAEAVKLALGPGTPLPEGTYVDESERLDEELGVKIC